MHTYHAILIHPEVSGGRCSGNIHITNSAIFFESEEKNHQITIQNLSITAGGAGNRFVFFKDANFEDISIYTSDKEILKSESITSNPKFNSEVNASKKTLRKLYTSSLLIVGVVLLFIGLLYFAKDKMVEHLANQIPQEWEKKAGDKLFTALSLQYKFVKNDSLKKEFLKVAQPLFKEVEKEGYTIDLYFVNDPTINAFALPGGKVIVQTGLIQNAQSWEEVMGVLGHELAHVTRRHHIRGIINNIGVFTILAATVGDISALAGTFANLGGELASLSNSRNFENEADETGWNYLVKAKINPSGLISFFEILKKENKTVLDSTLNQNVDLSFLSTHPDTQDRIDHLKEKIKTSNQKFNPLPNSFNQFKTALLKKNEL